MAARYEAACSNLGVYCPEGRDPKCVQVLRHIEESKLTPIDVDCLARAKSAEAGRKCGGVECKIDGKDATP